MPARLRATPQSPRSKQRSVAAAKSQAGAKSRAKRARASAATAQKSRRKREALGGTAAPSKARTPARRGTTPAYGEGSLRDLLAVRGKPVGGGARKATAIKSGARRRSKGEAALNREVKRRQASRGTSRKSQARAYGNVPMRRKPKPTTIPQAIRSSLGSAGAAPITPRTKARRAAAGTAAKDRARRRASAGTPSRRAGALAPSNLPGAKTLLGGKRRPVSKRTAAALGNAVKDRARRRAPARRRRG
jgi:hypothetical protein